MSLTDEEQRALRAKLEEAQGELARSREALVTAQVECKRLEEELAFARWALEAGESQGLKTALARSRAESESLRKELQRVGGLPRPKGALQVVLMSVTDQESAEEIPVVAYIGFVVDRDRTSRDVVRTRDPEFARSEVQRIARELNVPVEDLT
jgi:chromosome segregation ATPase